MSHPPQLETDLRAGVYTLTIKFAPNRYYPPRGHLQLTNSQLHPEQDLVTLLPGPRSRRLQAASTLPEGSSHCLSRQSAEHSQLLSKGETGGNSFSPTQQGVLPSWLGMEQSLTFSQHSG